MSMGAYPIVIVYNGRDHFVPTRPVDNIAYNTWKLKKQLGPILGAGLLVSKEINKATLDHTLLTSLNEVEACLAKHLPTLSPEGYDSYLTQAIDAPTRGPAFDPEIGAPLISAPPAPSGPSSGATAATSGPGSETAPPPPAKKKGRQPHVCEVCGTVKTRKPDMDGHRWFYHHLGTPIVCNIPPCKQKDFSARSALKQHVDNIHKKKFRYCCRDCPYGSDSRDYYLTHRVKKHGVTITSSKTKKTIVFTCLKCKKIFMGPSLLKRHTTRGLCMTRKLYQCRICLRMYKTQAYLDNHVQQLHTQGAKTWVCSKCQKVCNSQSAFHNHQLWHQGLNVLQRAQALTRRRRQMEAMKATSAHIQKKLPHQQDKPREKVPPKPRATGKGKAKGKAASTKSAPAKIIAPRRSPRQSRGKKGNK